MFRLAMAVVLAFFVLGGAYAHADVVVPPLTSRVTDETGTLTSDQMASLEKTLREFEAKRERRFQFSLFRPRSPKPSNSIRCESSSNGSLGARMSTTARS